MVLPEGTQVERVESISHAKTPDVENYIPGRLDRYQITKTEPTPNSMFTPSRYIWVKILRR